MKNLSVFPFLTRIMYDASLEDEYYRQMRQKSSSISAFKVGLVAAMGGFLYGYDTGLINDLLEMEYVYTHFPSNNKSFTSHERSILVAILSLGTFIGALIAPLASDRYGRKFSIMMSSGLIFITGNILQIASASIALMCVGRFVSGVSVGILSAIVPLYQAEVSPKWLRGSVVFTYQWSITAGLLVSSAVCQGTRKINNSGSYRIPIGLQFLWALILFFGMSFLPESPRYYVQQDNLQLALDSLCKLRKLPPDDDDLIEELVDIKANYDYELSYGKTTVLDCFKSGGGRHKQGLRMLTGIGVQFFQQCSGINFIFYYGVNFFSSTGINNYYIMSFITYLVNVIFTVPGIMMIDVVGRRPLLFWGGVGMAVCNFIIAIAGVSVKNDEVNGILCVSFACVFIAFFASTWGGCTWALCSDIYGISIRQKAVALTAATNWLVNFIFAFITPYLIDTGQHTAAIGSKIFFIWGSFNACGAIFVFFTVYETKGLKLEEVDYMYVHCDNARVSTKFISTKIDFAHLDENYNPIPMTQLPDSTSSNEMYHDKGSDENSSPQQLPHYHQQQPLYNGEDQNNLTIIPYDNSLTISSVNSIEERRDSIPSTNGLSFTSSSQSHPQSNSYSHSNSHSATYRSKSHNSMISNDYQLYLESIQREYSQHYQNSSAMIKQLSRNSRNNGSDQEERHEPIQKQEIIDSPLNINSINHINNIPTTVIATPFFAHPPSDSDSSDDEEEEEVVVEQEGVKINDVTTIK